MRWLFGLVILVVAGYILWPAMLRIPHIDESIYLYEGWLVAQGKLPYRDFFDFIWPLTFYWVGGLTAIFGMSLVVMRLSVLFMLLVSGGLVVWMGRQFLPLSWLRLLVLLLWVIHVPVSVQVQHHVMSMFWVLMAVAGLYYWLESSDAIWKRLVWLYVSGFCVGLSLITTQSLGGVMVVGLGLFLVLFGWQQKLPVADILKNLGSFWLAALLPLGVVLGYFSTQGALPEFREATFDWLWTGGYLKTTSPVYFEEGWRQITSVFNAQHVSLQVVLENIRLLLIGVLPLVGLAWGGYRCVVSSEGGLNTAQWQYRLLWLSGLFCFLATFSYPSILHVALNGWLLYLFAMMSVYRLLSTRRHPAVYRISLLLLVFMLFQQLGAAQSRLIGPRLRSYGTVEHALTSSWLPPSQVAALNRLVTFVHDRTPPGETFFVYNVAPELYLLSDRYNPTRYQVVMAVYNTPDQIREVAVDLDKKRPHLVLYNPIDAQYFQSDPRFQAYRKYDYHLKPIEAILTAVYVPVMQSGGVTLYALEKAGSAGGLDNSGIGL